MLKILVNILHSGCHQESSWAPKHVLCVSQHAESWFVQNRNIAQTSGSQILGSPVQFSSQETALCNLTLLPGASHSVIILALSLQCVDRRSSVHPDECVYHRNIQLFLQLWAGLLEALSVPLPPGLREPDVLRGEVPPLPHRGDHEDQSEGRSSAHGTRASVGTAYRPPFSLHFPLCKCFKGSTPGSRPYLLHSQNLLWICLQKCWLSVQAMDKPFLHFMVEQI